MKRLITICTIILVAGGIANADVYTTYASWSAAVSGNTIYTETFDGTWPNPDFTITSQESTAGVKAGTGVLGPDNVWFDRVISGGQQTTIQFNEGIYGFGANWDPAIPGGEGQSLMLYYEGTYVVTIPNTTQGTFFGFANVGTFDTILITANGTAGWCETFEMDDVVYAVPVPGAVLLGLLGLSAAGIKLRKFA